MARPREFDEGVVLDAAVQCFWNRGYEATSIKDLIGSTGLTAASLYNAYGDKRGFFRAALDRYVEGSVGDRLQRCEALPPREGIGAFFKEIVNRSLKDRDHKGCMLVNSAMEVAPHDPEFQKAISAVLQRVETFFLTRIVAGQKDGTITTAMAAETLARHLLGILVGIRVLARVRPERALLEGVVEPALALLDSTGLNDGPGSASRG
jgi:TetR/AcrR family transcriptional repressor of nem operon